MASKNLYLILITRVILLTITAIGLAFFVVDKQVYYAVVMGLVLFVQVLALIKYLNKINRRIAFFFNAVENDDTSIFFPEKIGQRSISEINKSLNRVNRLIQRVRIENRAQEQYYHSILEQAVIGILTINEKGHILFANSTVKKLLNYESLTHIHQLKKIDKKLFNLISPLSSFDQKLIQIPNERENVKLTINASSLSINEESLLLVVVQNIHNELDAKEVDSWIGLIRVLTHEIMNTIAPITSLSETLVKIYSGEEGLILPGKLTEKDIATTAKGLDIIQSQGNNLINFVSSYRSLTKIPHPEKEILSIQDIFNKIRILASQEEGFDQIIFEFDSKPDDLQIYADEKQLIQVLVNLVKNAIQALSLQSNAVIKLRAEKTDSQKVMLSVSDNGPGIPNDLIDQIFIPFFTTRENGTGIGLSLSRHIMKLHNGSLSVKTIPKEKTTFILTF